LQNLRHGPGTLGGERPLSGLRALLACQADHIEHDVGGVHGLLQIAAELDDVLPANIIDHEAERPPAPAPGVTAEYGGYLANSCQICHEKNLAGANDPGGGLNLTPAGNLASWSEEEFIKTLRTGMTPEGKKLDSELMPWPSVGKMTDDELKAIWMYLNTLPPVQTRQS
jgi:mono/diheme cytochrome c family protein